jgi:hypothetical protein
MKDEGWMKARSYIPNPACNCAIEADGSMRASRASLITRPTINWGHSARRAPVSGLSSR